MKGTLYTDAELTLLRDNYQLRGANWCAKELNRSSASVRDKALKIGIGRKRDTLPTQVILQAITKYHPLGYTDHEIYQIVVKESHKDFDRERVGKLRASIGLASNVSSERHRARMRGYAVDNLKKLNVGSLTELRWKRWREWKTKRGLPEDLTNIAAVALDHFLTLGPGIPISRIMLCGLLDIDPSDPNAPRSNSRGGTVLSELYHRGFIGRIRQAMQVQSAHNLGRGRLVRIDLYYLQQGVKRNEQHHDNREGVPYDSLSG